MKATTQATEINNNVLILFSVTGIAVVAGAGWLAADGLGRLLFRQASFLTANDARVLI